MKTSNSNSSDLYNRSQSTSEWQNNDERGNMNTSRALVYRYDAAILFLDRADFLRNHDKRSAQAVGILSVVSINVGDSAVQMTDSSARCDPDRSISAPGL